MTQTHPQIIKERGGPKAFAEAVGVQPKTAQMWVFRKKIPRDAWPEVIAAFPELTVETLKGSEPPRRAA